VATDLSTPEPIAQSRHSDAPLDGAALDRYRRVYAALWRSPFTGGPVTQADLDHLSDLLEAKRGRGDAVGFL
jgi:hypothetical protein